MTRAEKASLLIAGFALTISFVSMYFQFFYDSFEITGRVVGPEIVLAGDSLESDRYSLDVAFSNSGTVPAALINVCSALETKSGPELLYCDKQKFPIVLEPNDIVFYKYAGPGVQDSVIASMRAQPDTLAINLRIEFLGANGVQKARTVEIGSAKITRRNSTTGVGGTSFDLKAFILN